LERSLIDWLAPNDQRAFIFAQAAKLRKAVMLHTGDSRATPPKTEASKSKTSSPKGSSTTTLRVERPRRLDCAIREILHHVDTQLASCQNQLHFRSRDSMMIDVEIVRRRTMKCPPTKPAGLSTD
jgi:hypothetical protein